MPALDTQTPLTMTLPMPQPIRACVIALSGWCIGETDIACAAEARANPKITRAIVLIIVSSRLSERFERKVAQMNQK
jgi:hypothetical protein